MRLYPLPLAAAAILAISTASASAHPTLVRSTPRAGSKIAAPEQVSLLFSEKIEPVFNKIEIVDNAGTHFEDGNATPDGVNQAILHVRLKQLPAGLYKVRWRVSAADTHKMEGSFGFEVVP